MDELEDILPEETDFLQPELPVKQPKKVGRKKVAKRKKLKPQKNRGQHLRNKPQDSLLEGDDELAECMFSDDDMRQDYINSLKTDGESVASLEISEPGTSASSSFVDSDLSRLDSSASSSSRLSSSRSSMHSSVLSVTLDSVISPNESGQLQGEDQQEDETMEEIGVEPYIPSLVLIENGLNECRKLLPEQWLPIADRDGFHFLLLSAKFPKAVQKEIFVSYIGNVHVLVHCKPVPAHQKLFELDSIPLVRLSEDTLLDFCNYGVTLVKKCLQFDLCLGADDLDSRHVWELIEGGYIDSNPYMETKYTETYRSVACSRLIILGRGKRCAQCAKLMRSIAHRKEFLLSPSADPSTNNKNLTHHQALKKLEIQQENIRKKDKKIAHLQSKVNTLLEREGVNIDEDLHETFSRVLMESDKLTDVQRMFLQEQWSSAHKHPTAHTWHPSMIRFALSIYMNGSGNYDSIRDLGVVRLPHSRTLYDYSHSIKAKDGVNEEIVKLVADRVEALGKHHKEFHVLLCDGMHVSQNLVYRKSDGSLVGFEKLDEIDKEMERLENYMDGKDATSNKPKLATEVVAFMVKGLCSDVKAVVASFPMKLLTKEKLYRRSWEVIGHLETAGVKVLAYVCDGHSCNRAFIKMHKPITTDTKFGGIFDTINFCAPDQRPLYFISDLCHLIKTIRNAFYNSGDSPKKPRLLVLNGESIVWKHIIRLYLTFKNHTFRKSYKLNAQNVFPNSYSRMKVPYAVQVLSKTVGVDLKAQEWPSTSETVRFITLCDRFFDCLNGAHSSITKRRNKPDVAPYTKENIASEISEGRFKFLREFIDYLYEWKVQVDDLPLSQTEKERAILPMQTLMGIEMTIRGIEAAILYYLDPLKGGADFVNARAFSQDPLEHHFSRQRAKGGGSRNPNVSQFQQNQVSLALQRGLGIKRRGANSAEQKVGMELSTEPVPKKKRSGK